MSCGTGCGPAVRGGSDEDGTVSRFGRVAPWSERLARLAQDVLKFTFCLAGVAQSGRAADL
jgi:hypothetical protein